MPTPLGGSDVTPEAQTLEERTLEQRMSDALEVVELHHHRIASTIRSLWGYKECGAYINKLIMNGGDGMGHARIGFNQEAVAAMIKEVLAANTIKMPLLAMPLRLILTGQLQTPAIDQVVVMFGRETVLARLAKWL